MRDLTKSFFSFSWALSLFGVQQTLNMLSPPKTTKAFENVTKATEGELGNTFKAAFRSGDNLQKELVDLTLGAFTLQAFNPSSWMKTVSDVAQQAVAAIGQAMPGMPTAPPAGSRSQPGSASQSAGWGPVNSPGCGGAKCSN